MRAARAPAIPPNSSMRAPMQCSCAEGQQEAPRHRQDASTSRATASTTTAAAARLDGKHSTMTWRSLITTNQGRLRNCHCHPRAMRGADVYIHAGAPIKNPWVFNESRGNTLCYHGIFSRTMVPMFTTTQAGPSKNPWFFKKPVVVKFAARHQKVYYQPRGAAAVVFHAPCVAPTFTPTPVDLSKTYGFFKKPW